MTAIRFANAVYDCGDAETVLDTLLRNGVGLSYSCRKGLCQTCMMRAVHGQPPAAAQAGLRDTLREQGYFLPCLCVPGQALEIAAADAAFVAATVAEVEHLGPSVCRLVLEPTTPLNYRAGQFINLRRDDGLQRSYSLASAPALDPALELHVKRLPGGIMSNWICDALQAGARVEIRGPNGNCFYVPGRPDQPLVLIGNGTGLAPLIGILRDALHNGHRGSIRLYHGSRHGDGLYRHRLLTTLAADHANLTYRGCVSGPTVAPGCLAGRADAIAFSDLADLDGWRVFLCGYPPMVHGARKTAYLRGAAMDDIHADPFELRELRDAPRPGA